MRLSSALVQRRVTDLQLIYDLTYERVSDNEAPVIHKRRAQQL